MKAPKSLAPPDNWQDFEMLCKKLWTAIWQCPEVIKNGRNGQVQHGVDVYGLPKDESQYVGIQCKGKDSHFAKGFTEKEILAEVEKAKLFTPALGKLYLATTAQKDATIEAFVRQLHVQHLQQGFFGVHLYAWQDIVDLICEHKSVYDWYVLSQGYKGVQEIAVSLASPADGRTGCWFKRVKAMQRLFTEQRSSGSILDYTNLEFMTRRTNYGMPPERTNLSLFEVSLSLTNIGTLPIEDYLVEISFKGAIQTISDTDKEGGTWGIRSIYNEVDIDKQRLAVKFQPKVKVLVPGQTERIDFFIKPEFNEDPASVVVCWKLLSRDYSSNGELPIKVIMAAYQREEEKFVKDPCLVGRMIEELKDLYWDEADELHDLEKDGE